MPKEFIIHIEENSMKRFLWLYLLVLYFSGCNEDSPKRESKWQCDDRDVDEFWKGEKVTVKRCQQGKVSIMVALNASGDTVYVMTQLSTSAIEVIHYLENAPDRKAFEVNTSNGYVVNQQFKKHEDSGFIDESMLKTFVKGDTINLCVNKRIADSALFIGKHEIYLSLTEANKTYKGRDDFDYFHDCFDISTADLADKHAVFLVFFSEKDREGIGVIPFYMDSTLADRSARGIN